MSYCFEKCGFIIIVAELKSNNFLSLVLLIESTAKQSITTMSSNEIEELGGSELGTKDYWDKSYNTEIANYKSHGDVGEVWFDEDSQIRVINWMLRNDIPENSEIIDLGKF